MRITARKLSQPPVTPLGPQPGPERMDGQGGADALVSPRPAQAPRGPPTLWLAPGLTGMLSINQFLQRHRHLLLHSAGVVDMARDVEQFGA